MLKILYELIKTEKKPTRMHLTYTNILKFFIEDFDIVNSLKDTPDIDSLKNIFVILRDIDSCLLYALFTNL